MLLVCWAVESGLRLAINVVIFKVMNENQRKHAAASLRIIGLAQFASYGYISINSAEWLVASASALIYVGLELTALFTLKD